MSCSCVPISEMPLPASTTIVSFPDPFTVATTTVGGGVVLGMYNGASGYTGATSTIDMATLNITTGATSTFTVICGAATGPTTAATNAILSSGSVATSSIGIITNNFDGDTLGVTGGSVAKIQLNPTYPWFNCIVTTAYSGAFTEATNTFDGTFSVQVNRPR